jgi:hypothetical protein
MEDERKLDTMLSAGQLFGTSAPSPVAGRWAQNMGTSFLMTLDPEFSAVEDQQFGFGQDGLSDKIARKGFSKL